MGNKKFLSFLRIENRKDCAAILMTLLSFYNKTKVFKDICI